LRANTDGEGTDSGNEDSLVIQLQAEEVTADEDGIGHKAPVFPRRGTVVPDDEAEEPVRF